METWWPDALMADVRKEAMLGLDTSDCQQVRMYQGRAILSQPGPSKEPTYEAIQQGQQRSMRDYHFSSVLLLTKSVL